MTQADLNPIGFLQEFVQKHNVAQLPKYKESGAVGLDHVREFSYTCFFDGYEVVGLSRQKKLAKSEAAKNMIELLKEKKYFENHGFSFVNGVIRAIDRSNISLQGGASLEGGVTDSVDIGNLPSTKNPISALQEYCQLKKLPLPDYFDTSVQGSFVYQCTLMERKTYGNGTTKKGAKTESAAKMCNELHISFSGEELVKKETVREEVEFKSDKNPVSALQELCMRNKYPTPYYDYNITLLKQFMVSCTVGKVTKKGMGTSKKEAKILAAQNVYSELITNGLEGYNGVTDPEQPDVATNGSVPADSGSEQPHVATNGSVPAGSGSEQPDVATNGSVPADSGSTLMEWILNNDEDDVSSSGNQQPAEDLSVIKTMESLNLDDSVVEVEPQTSTITIHSSVRLLSDPPQDSSTKTKNDKEDTHLHMLKTPTSESVLKWAKKMDSR